MGFNHRIGEYKLHFMSLKDMVIKMKKETKKIDEEIRIKSIDGQPENSFELINKYGTYEIQPTADSGNEYPKIAQGKPKSKNVKNPNLHQPK